MTIAANYAAVIERVRAAAERAGRSPGEVAVVAVSKTFPAHAVLEAVAAGVTVFGENRARELGEKVAAIGDRAEWHFVGHLQTNKVRHVVGVAALIHSVDRVGLAEAISRRARTLGVTQPVLVEVNVAGEATKHGIEVGRAVALAEEVASMSNLELRGLMTVPPWPEDPEDSRPLYEELAHLRDRVLLSVPSAGGLSMGMSRDFEVAIEEGATLVRIGEAIFGPRPDVRPSQ